MARFVIDLGDLEMSPADEMALSGELQKVALGYISGMKFERPFVVRFPWEWLGLIMRGDIERLRVAEKEIAGVIGHVRG